MHPGYFLAAALVAIEAGILAWAASPDVDPAYRAVYIDHTANCYPVEVSGEYELGSTVSFAQYGSSRFRDTITRCGWRDPARDGSWSDGEVSMFRFRLDPAPTDLALDLVIWPYIVDGLVESQRIVISVNEQPLTVMHLDRDTLPYRRVVIPRAAARPRDGVIEIAFDYPDARSPSELGLFEDRYRYAAFLHSVRFDRIYPPPR